jgi:hypothetical protein
MTVPDYAPAVLEPVQPDRTIQSTPVDFWTTVPESRAIVAARGDALRAAGLALPLCWLPESRKESTP